MIINQPLLNIILRYICYNYFINLSLLSSMADKTISPYRKRFNTEIISKTQIALEAIKRYDMEQSKSNFFNHQKIVEKTILKELDSDYTMLTSSKKIEADRIYKINLFPYSQQFYCLDMTNYVFPMRVLLKNVRSEGTIYVGYDHQFPGVINRIKKQSTEIQTAQTTKNYDYKSIFNKDILITLKNKNNRSIKCIYFSLIAGSSLLMFHFKVEFLGFSRESRFLSSGKLNPHQLRDNKSTERQQIPKLSRQKTEPTQTLKQSIIKSKLPEISKSTEKTVRIQEFHVFSDQMPKHTSKVTLSPDHILSKSKKVMNETRTMLLNATTSQQIPKINKNGSGLISQKSEVSQRLEEIKRNRYLLEVYKEKDKQLREASSKCKKLIQDYQKTYNQENVRKCKLNRSIVLILYSMLYVSSVHHEYRATAKRVQAEFKITFLCKRFVRRLKKKHQQSCKMIPYRSKRHSTQALTAIDLQSRFIYKQSSNIAQNVIKQTLLFLKPIYSVNHSLLTANVYRDKLKLIQRVWKSKYHSRIYSLLYFIDNHVEKMTKEFPHLKLFVEQFHKSGANRQISLNYVKDESEKFRFIYEAYLRKLEEISEMNQANRIMTLQGSQKPRLIVPKRPVRPMHRFYRNCDILKSMVRAWFQIQYKKFFKKSNPKYTK